jgi:hypothetical protein
MAVPVEGAAPRRPGLWGTGTPVWIAALLALALAGFWKSYVSRVAAADAITHLHAGLMLAWFAMLFAQPVLVRTRRLALHRQVGRLSYVLVPAIVLTCVLLSRMRMAAVAPQGFGMQCVFLYLGLSAAAMFLLFWGLAIAYRRDAALHARYMVGTALVMIDPALARIVGGLAPQLGIGVLWISYGVVFTILGLLIYRDRGRHGQRAFVLQLALFATNFVMIHLVPGSAGWQAFARAWGALPPG